MPPAGNRPVRDYRLIDKSVRRLPRLGAAGSAARCISACAPQKSCLPVTARQQLPLSSPDNMASGDRRTGIIMHKLLLGSIAVASLIAGPAVAADLPLKAPPPAVVYDSWTGFYVGAALGGKWANTTWTTTSTSDFPGTIVDASSPRNFNPSGARIAGYAGYNWQNQAWLFGVEFDVAYANNTASSVGIPGCTILCFPGAPGPGVDTSTVKMGWDAALGPGSVIW